MSDFGVGELIYDGEIYDKMNNFAFDLDFYKKWCGRRPGRVLELCCGTGRLTLPLKASGIDIMGLDGSDSMLEMARRKAGQQKLEVDFRKGDMRGFDLGCTFSTIFIPFNSLQNTYSIEDLERIFRCVRKHLEPDGLFIFDIFNPSIHMMVEREKELKEAFRFTLDDGRPAVVLERCNYDAASQVNRVEWVFRIGTEERSQRLDMRCFFPLEMDVILAYNGWNVEVKFGSFDENLFQSPSSKQIFVCRMAGAAKGGS